MMSRWLQAVALGTFGAAVVGAVSCGGADSVVTVVPGKSCVFYYAGGGVETDHADGSTFCGAGACNYQTQTGCATGQTCAPHVDTTTSTIIPICRAAGTQKKGQPCDDTVAQLDKQCAAGLLCGEKVCRTVCCGGDWTACAPDEGCFHQAHMLVGTDKQSVYAHADLCYPVGTCDVLDEAACSDVKQTCRLVDGRPSVACTPSTDLKLGDPCTREHQCGAGQICVGSGNQAVNGSSTIDGTCRRLCRWTCDGKPGCEESEGVCVRFDRDPPGVGECTPNWHGAPIIVDGGGVPDVGAPARSGGARERDAGNGAVDAGKG